MDLQLADIVEQDSLKPTILRLTRNFERLLILLLRFPEPTQPVVCAAKTVADGALVRPIAGALVVVERESQRLNGPSRIAELE